MMNSDSQTSKKGRRRTGENSPTFLKIIKSTLGKTTPAKTEVLSPLSAVIKAPQLGGI